MERNREGHPGCFKWECFWPSPPADDRATTHRKRSCHFYTISNFFFFSNCVCVCSYAHVFNCILYEIRRYLIVFVSIRKGYAYHTMEQSYSNCFSPPPHPHVFTPFLKSHLNRYALLLLQVVTVWGRQTRVLQASEEYV